MFAIRLATAIRILLPVRWLILAMIVSASSAATETNPDLHAEQIRVGLYQNEPIIYYDDGPKGLFVEILNHIAQQEGWRLDYVICELEDCLQDLADNRLDLMTSLEETPERLKQFIFSKEPVWTFWGTVYSGDKRIDSIFDLKGMRVGVGRENKTTVAFKKLVADFNIPVEYVAFGNGEAAFRALANGGVDAVAIDNTNEFNERRNGTRFFRTPIAFNPFSTYFAGYKGSGKTDILDTIDYHVKALKANPASLYYAFQERWFGVPEAYWNVRRIGAISIILLMAIVISMATWRYRAVVNLNRALNEKITERVLVEKALEKSEVRFRRIVETANEGVWSIDRDHRTVFVNPIMARMLGYTPQEMVGRPMDDFLFPQDMADHNRKMKLRAKGENQRYERRLRRKDGTEIWTLVSATAMKDPSGAFSGSFAMLTDITQRKRLDQVINGVFQSSSPSFDQTFLDSMVIEMSKTLNADYMLIGEFTDPSNMTVRTISVMAAGEMVPNFEYGLAGTPCEAVLESGVCSYSGNVADQFPDDHLIKEMGVEAYVGIPLLHADQGPMGIMAALFRKPLTDTQLAEMILTFFSLRVAGEIERRKTENDLRESHNQFLTVLDGIDASIYVADMHNHEILFMNEHKKKVFGQNLIGQQCWLAFRGESAPCTFCMNDALVDEAGNPAGVRVWEDHNALNDRWYLNYDRAIKWVDDRLVKLQVATDVTPLKEMETERQEYRRRIQQMQKLEAIGTLAGGIAHDFNNILSAVIGYSEIALDDEMPADTPARESLENVLKAAFRAKELVKQILAFSRQTHYEKRTITIGPMVKETIKLLRASLPATIDIRLDNRAGMSSIMGDPTQINQVLMNLCTNAAYAMRDSGGILHLTLSATRVGPNEPDEPGDVGPGSYVKLTVADNGPGMAPSIVEQIFDPFFTTKPKEEGTGLGLSVVHGIVGDHEGHITVDSQPGRGTVFSVYFPQVEGHVDGVISDARPLSSGNERILLVEDEVDIASATATILDRAGYKVTTMTSSRQAMAVFEAHPEAFDLVITDQTMPEMTGDQLALKILGLRADIPIIMCTGYSHTIDDTGARELGIREFIMKPIVSRDLAAAIRRVLDQPGSE